MKTNSPSGKLKLDQQGFSPVEVVLVVVAIAVFGLVGWYVYMANHQKVKSSTISTNSSSSKSSNSSQANANSFKDSSDVYSVNYPKNWTTSQQQATESLQGFSLVDSNLVNFTPPNAPNITTVKSSGSNQANSVGVLAYSSGDTKAILADYQTGTGHSTAENMTVNGYPAMYQQSTSTRAPTYTDDVYAVTHNGVTVVFTFREKQGSDKTGTPAFDATNSVPAFTAIVYSTKFMN